MKKWCWNRHSCFLRTSSKHNRRWSKRRVGRVERASRESWATSFDAEQTRQVRKVRFIQSGVQSPSRLTLHSRVATGGQTRETVSAANASHVRHPCLASPHPQPLLTLRLGHHFGQKHHFSITYFPQCKHTYVAENEANGYQRASDAGPLRQASRHATGNIVRHFCPACSAFI